jgi:hypothetical protein
MVALVRRRYLLPLGHGRDQIQNCLLQSKAPKSVVASPSLSF